MIKKVAISLIAVALVAFFSLLIFISLLTSVSAALRVSPNSDEKVNDFDDSFDPDMALDTDYNDDSYTDNFVVTMYYPNSPADPMGGGDTCADGTKFTRDPNVPVERNLFAKTPDGRTIQGVVAIVQDRHDPKIPWSMKDQVTLNVPAYFPGAEIHDHFAACVTDPKRLDLAMSGPEQGAKFFADLKTVCPEAKPYSDPGGSNYNSGTLLPVGVTISGEYLSGELSATRQKLIQILLAQRGKPYVLGGAGPDVFDCSGLVLWSYHQISNSKPKWHHTNEQCAEGRPITPAQAIPGDCIYFGSNLHHVGIFLGNGKYIHAPQTGDVVKISDLSGRTGQAQTWVRFMDPDKDIPDSGDPATRLNTFMKRKGFNKDLASLAPFMVDASKRYGMDFRMAAVTALVESSGGHRCFRPFNPYGMGEKTYASFKDATEDYFRTIAVYGLGNNPGAIFLHYNGKQGYADNCMKELSSI